MGSNMVFRCNLAVTKLSDQNVGKSFKSEAKTKPTKLLKLHPAFYMRERDLRPHTVRSVDDENPLFSSTRVSLMGRQSNAVGVCARSHRSQRASLLPIDAQESVSQKS